MNRLPAFDGRLNIFDRELVILRRLVSPRLNGSYEDEAVICGGVVADPTEFNITLPPFL